MIEVQYTLAGHGAGEFKNIYKSRKFGSHASAEKYAETLRAKPDVTDVRLTEKSA